MGKSVRDASLLFSAGILEVSAVLSMGVNGRAPGHLCPVDECVGCEECKRLTTRSGRVGLFPPTQVGRVLPVVEGDPENAAVQ
jgi:hypothetical protein